MSFEPRGAVPFGEAPQRPASAGAGEAAAGGVPPALRVQILATEHWSLLATRSLAWNEVFSRAGMLLSALSGAIVALALVGQGSNFGSTFALFGIAILPVVLFIGETTYLRMGESNMLDAQCVIGMNRIRHAYLEVAPDLERYFVTSSHDDVAGVGITMGSRPAGASVAHLLSATPIVVMVINAVIAGAIAGLVLAQAGLAGVVAVVASIAVSVALFAVHAAHGRRTVMLAQASVQPRFPSPPPDPEP